MNAYGTESPCCAEDITALSINSTSIYIYIFKEIDMESRRRKMATRETL